MNNSNSNMTIKVDTVEELGKLSVELVKGGIHFQAEQLVGGRYLVTFNGGY